MLILQFNFSCKKKEKQKKVGKKVTLIVNCYLMDQVALFEMHINTDWENDPNVLISTQTENSYTINHLYGLYVYHVGVSN